jgi:hypothetical protein
MFPAQANVFVIDLDRAIHSLEHPCEWSAWSPVVFWEQACQSPMTSCQPSLWV